MVRAALSALWHAPAWDAPATLVRSAAPVESDRKATKPRTYAIDGRTLAHAIDPVDAAPVDATLSGLIVDSSAWMAYSLNFRRATVKMNIKNHYRNAGLCLALFASSLSLAETWHADPITGCTVFDQEDVETVVQVSWSGDCDENNLASGNGVLSWIDDGKLLGRYDGAMAEGKANGQGVLLIVNAAGGHDRFEGQFKDNEIDGYVVAKTADGISFEGRMSSADLSGNGLLRTLVGDQYTGDLLHGKMHGAGHLIIASGDQYRGTFENDELEGSGEWLGANGDYYKGDFVAGVYSGQGRYEGVDGDLYEGEFADGLPNGEGRFTRADGRILTGQFKAGWPDGEVDVTTTDGRSLVEMWRDGKLEGTE